MPEEFFGERTEKATTRRRGEARKKGQVARSREIPSVLVMMTGIGILFFLSSSMYQQLSGVMVRFLKQMGNVSIDAANFQALSLEILWLLGQILAPLSGAVIAMAVLGNYAQVGSLFTLEAIRPNFSRLNFFKGLPHLVSKQAMVEWFKSLGKIGIIGWVSYSTIREDLPQILALTSQEVKGIFGYISLISFRIFWKTLLAMVVLAALDYVFQRWQYEKSLRMTKREVQDEYKQSEGNPMIKSRIRSIQRDLARRRMMAEVPKADVIITNPTHLAVALSYVSREMAAPKVLAKGAGFVAEKMKEIGRDHQIPIVENKPLAQVLYQTVDIGQMIPSTLYQVVADVLAYVYRLKKQTV